MDGKNGWLKWLIHQKKKKFHLGLLGINLYLIYSLTVPKVLFFEVW
jgi:hypothetical protein